MSTNALIRTLYAAVFALSVLLALSSLRFLAGMEQGLDMLAAFYGAVVSKAYVASPTAYMQTQRAFLPAHALVMSLHVLGMATAALVGGVQLLPALRRARPRLHRVLGALYVAGVLVGGGGGIALTASGRTYGHDTALGRGVEAGNVGLAVLLWIATAAAVVSAIRGDRARHGRWMVRSYALVATAITLRLGFLLFGWLGYDFQTGYLASTSVAVFINLLVAEWVVSARPRRDRRDRRDTGVPRPRVAALAALATTISVLAQAALLVATRNQVLEAFSPRFAYALNAWLGLAAAALYVVVSRRGHRIAALLVPATQAALVAVFMALGTKPAPAFVSSLTMALPINMMTAALYAEGTQRRLRGLGRLLGTAWALVFGATSLALLACAAVVAFAWEYARRGLRLLPGTLALEIRVSTATAFLFFRLGERVLDDCRDHPVLAVFVKGTLTLVPLLAYEVASGRVHPWIALLYLALLCGPRFEGFVRLFSTLHQEGHRRDGFFAAPYARVLGRYGEWFLGLFYGNVPELGRTAHVQIHHREDAGPADVQRSGHYDHASVIDFLRFLSTENLATSTGWAPVRYLANKRGARRGAHLGRLLGGVATFAAFALALAWRSPWLALTYALAPFLMHNAITALAAFAQHSFHVGAARDEGGLWSTVTLLDVHRHRGDFLNEGHHLAHHHRCAVHWSELPAHFEARRPEYLGKGAIVFRDLDWIELWMLCLRKRFDVLADHLVVPPGDPRSLSQLAEALRHRARAGARAGAGARAS